MSPAGFGAPEQLTEMDLFRFNVPLLIIAPGMLIGSARGHAWACYVVNLYFITGVLNTFEPGQRIYGWAEVLLSVSLFCAALLYTRWRFQYERKLAGED